MSTWNWPIRIPLLDLVDEVVDRVLCSDVSVGLGDSWVLVVSFKY